MRRWLMGEGREHTQTDRNSGARLSSSPSHNTECGEASTGWPRSSRHLRLDPQPARGPATPEANGVSSAT
ncbi:hypothetical protein E2C01_005182 [Portunus trituberculatus]|uniref:Uncharacterized protein n=1 Tax=Portunus trituberculatus TaxID=210409 RepID=A0A5B7CYF7_PORTR|nr:hypothetical protein [Portunus trituberculatus]